MPRKLLLIDASNSIYRAFYALPALSNAAGVPTNATLGFVNMLQKVLRDESPDYAVIVWDSRKAKRRKELYPEYKATRDATPELLATQIPYIRKAVDGYRLASMEYEGEEADDVIATLVQLAEQEGLEVGIVSSDRDLMQLVSDKVTLLDTMRDRRVGPAEVEERFGVPPERMLDLRALTGDSSDNIPGVSGIGGKGAATLLQTYGTLDDLLQKAAEIKAKRQREALLAGADDARLSRELSRLRQDLPLEFELSRFEVGEPDRAALIELFGELEFKRLLEEQGGSAAPAQQDSEIEIELIRDLEALRALVKRLNGSDALGIACVLEPDDAMQGQWVGLALAENSSQAALLVSKQLGEDVLLEELRPVLEDSSRTWLGFGLKRVALALARRGIELGGELRDTGVAAYLIESAPQATRPDFLARSYLSRSVATFEDAFGKGAKRRALDVVDEVELADFYAVQVTNAFELDPLLEREMEAKGQLQLFRDIEVPLVRVLARMELLGVRVDEAKLQALAQEMERDLAAHEKKIHELAGESFNIGSPKQLQHILFEKMSLPPTKKTKTGFSTDESVLEELAIEHELPREILSYRKLSKLKSTYVDALPKMVHPETGRIHGSFNQTVAATGRLSASNPNLQNIPVRTVLGQRIRETFIPAEGSVLLSADYSQIELRILAHLSGDEVLLKAFREGEDIHVRTACDVLGVAPEEVTEEQRSHMKAINFGIIYGSSAFGIARQLGISQGQAQGHIKAYFARYPGVRGFLDGAIAQAREKGYAETLDGRRRYLPDLHSKNRVLRSAAERMATNSVLQGTAADFLKRAMVAIHGDLEASGAPAARMILTVHDELVFEVEPRDREALCSQVVERMQGVAQLAVPLEVNVGWGQNWREAH